MSEIRIEVRQLTMKELFAVRTQIGRSVLTELLANKSLDEEMLAALIWITRRRTEPELTFEDVFSAAWMQNEVILDFGESDPPLAAAASTTRKRSRPSAGSIRPGRLES